MALVAAVAAVDGAVKVRALGSFPPLSTPAATDGLRLAQVQNAGFMLGLVESGPLLVLLALAISAAFLLSMILGVAPAGAPERVAVGLFVGGILGNSLDRIIDGRVTDYLDLVLGGRSVLTVNLSDVSMAVAILIVVGTIAGLRATAPRAPDRVGMRAGSRGLKDRGGARTLACVEQARSVYPAAAGRERFIG